MVSRFRKYVPSALTAAAAGSALILFLALPARYAESVKTGAGIWAVSVLPATLPLLFLTGLLADTPLFARITSFFAPAAGKLLRVSGAGACAGMLSLLSGYPVGARTVADLKAAGRIGESELLRVSALASTSGPAFLVGAVGAGMFASPKIGWILFLSHALGVLLVCLALRVTAKEVPVSRMQAPRPRPLGEVLSGAVASVLTVGGAVAIFYAFGAMIADMGALLSLPWECVVFLRGLLEMTSGCAAFAGNASPFALFCCAFFVTFGGVSVLLQQLTFLGPAGIDGKKFVAVKLVQGLVAGGIALGLSPIAL